MKILVIIGAVIPWSFLWHALCLPASGEMSLTAVIIQTILLVAQVCCMAFYLRVY